MIKPAYTSVPLHTGMHTAGICKIQIAPIAWLVSDITKDYLTGTVLSAANTFNRPLLDIEFAAETAKHQEKLKVSKAGDYYDISVTCIGNNLTAPAMNSLVTLKGEKLFCILTFADRTQRIIGNITEGMKLQFSTDHSQANQIPIELLFNSPEPSPFYEP